MSLEDNIRSKRLHDYYDDKLKQFEQDMNLMIDFIIDPLKECCYDDFKTLNYIMVQVKKLKKNIIDLEIKDNGK